jgi:hypothetical protein
MEASTLPVIRRIPVTQLKSGMKTWTLTSDGQFKLDEELGQYFTTSITQPTISFRTKDRRRIVVWHPCSTVWASW